MAFDGIDPFKVYEGIRRCKEGKQLEAVLRALCFILDSWFRFGAAEGQGDRPPRKGRYGEPDKGMMQLIEFGKLANIVCRVWSEMFKMTGLALFDRDHTPKPEDINAVVRFRPPVLEMPGKHGSGMARRISEEDKPVYLTQMIEKLTDEEELPYFSLLPSEAARSSGACAGAPGGRTSSRKVDEPNKWAVLPALAVSDDKVFWDGFTECEVSLFRDLANALKHLGPTEIRALGVHKDRDGTVEDVRRELRWARTEKGRITEDLASRRVEMTHAEQFQSYSQEACRKAELNRSDYGDGHRLMLQELTDGKVKEAFRRSHKPMDTVWGHPELEGLVAEAKRVAAVADCIYGIAFFCEHPEERVRQASRLAKHARHCWDDGLIQARKCGISGLPEPTDPVFDNKSGRIRGEVVNSLLEIVVDC